jgi:hypothetical protein
MDLDVDIENITFPDVEVSARENVHPVSALMIQDETFSDEEMFVVQNASFDKESKKLVFERTTKSKSGKLWSTIDTRDMLPSKLSSIHRVTGDALDVSIAHMEEENAQLKEIIKELEETLMPPPILASPVAMIRPGKGLQENPEPSSRVKGISSLITATRHFVEQNIKKRMSLIVELWDMEKSFASLGLRIQNTKEYLNSDLKNDEGFYTDGVVMFTMKVSTMTEKTRKQENLPSLSRIKQLKSCWMERINVLKGLITQLTDLSRRKNEAYLKILDLDIVGTTIEVPDPKYLSNSMLMTRQHFEEKIEELKRTSAEKFDNMMEFTHDDIDSWLVEYTNKNEDIENILQNLSVDLREIEKELFNVKIKQEVIVAPLRDFIQEWLNNSIAKISEIPAEVVMTGNQTTTNKSIKEATTSK